MTRRRRRATRVEVHVSRLRKALGARLGRSRRARPATCVRVEPGELDLHRFERLLAAGRAALERVTRTRGDGGCGRRGRLWRGRPLADLEFEPFARIDVQRLEELRLSAGGPDRGRPGARAGTRHCPRARGARRRASATRAPARAADAGAVPHRPPGRGARGVPRRAVGARRARSASSRAPSCASSTRRSCAMTKA